MSKDEQKAIKVIEEINKNMEYKYDKKIGQYVCIALRHCDRKVFKTLLNLIEKQRKDIEREKQYTDFYKDLCDKQQKELENNKKFKRDIVNLIMLWDEEDLPENDRVIECLDTIMSEVSRLEDIEDRKIQVEVKFVEEKRDKHWEKKIKEKIKELEEEKNNYFEKQVIQGRIDLLNELLEE